jgi:predicted HicB family RNase H-like nuclease
MAREGTHQVITRMPVKLHAALEKRAVKEGLSVNALVIRIVEEFLNKP